ncbi:type IV secretory pathway, VirB4 component [Pseudomonas luteola]|uniref:Type IV secretory pathway, VirB4 component n=1 Tax=Pseudomonas luteola TaxID=47886 RepID=A0A2X2C5T5_PSELU|nr:conjugative transfer ATPase [Pseudomonas luteola]SPZ02573.1 type IV secretory pathway, VirB4 component [Pseudomonas luteola]
MNSLSNFSLFKHFRNKAVSEKVVEEPQDAWEAHVNHLAEHGIPEPGSVLDSREVPPTRAEINTAHEVSPSFVKRLPWVEFLHESQCMLLEDNESVAAFYDLTPVGTEGRESDWLRNVRDALENALQDSFDELEDSPWVVQFYAQDETNWDGYMDSLRQYIKPRAQGTPFTEHYLRFFAHHLKAIAKPGGLFEDTTISKLPWRGQQRRVRMVIYRWAKGGSGRRGQSSEQALNTMCDRLIGGMANAGVVAKRMEGAEIHDWLLRWFNPDPKHIQDKDEFYRLTSYPEVTPPDELELASGTDFSERLFFSQPRSNSQEGVWLFDAMPHRVVMVDRLRTPPSTGHLTGETRKGGDAINAMFDQLPEDTCLCITMLVTPQDILEAKLNHLGKKSVGETLSSEQARQDIQSARSIIGSAHKLYQGSVAFYIRGKDTKELDSRSLQLNNVLLNNGIQPVRDEDEVAPLNSYLRWLPCCFDPSVKNAGWYTQLMFAQHIANLAPVWGRSQGTGNPGITLFNRGGGTITFDPLNGLDRQMNAHLFLFGPTGSGKSATLNYLLNQVTAIYRPRLFIVEAGNSFGLYADFCKRLGLTVNRVKLAPGAGVSLAPFADAWRLVETPSQVMTVNPELDDEDDSVEASARSITAVDEEEEKRDVLGELEIIARLMITGGEVEEEKRLTRADRSRIRKCIIDAAHVCVAENRTVLTRDVRDAIRREAENTSNDITKGRLLDMADAMGIFCQGTDGAMFDRDGSPWPEADVTIVDLATYAREGYSAQLSISYISLINTVNNIAERDQMLGRPIINVTDEGHIITKNPLLSPYVVKITKMWRKLGAWFWLATQNVDDLPKAAEPMLNMIEWWICLSMPPDEVGKIARFRELNDAQKALMLSARKEKNKFAEGVVLSKSMELLFRTVPPSLYLAMAMTEPEEKNERFRLMQEHGIEELDAAIMVAERIDQARGIALLDRGAMAAKSVIGASQQKEITA